MVLTTEGGVRSRFTCAALIALLLWTRPAAVPAKLRQSQDRPGIQEDSTALFLLPERRSRLRPGLTATRECTPQCTSGHGAELAWHSPAWLQTRWSLRQRNIPAALCANAQCDRTAEHDSRAAQSFRCHRQRESDRARNRY